jgi:hypothetical protein
VNTGRIILCTEMLIGGAQWPEVCKGLAFVTQNITRRNPFLVLLSDMTRGSGTMDVVNDNVLQTCIALQCIASPRHAL